MLASIVKSRVSLVVGVWVVYNLHVVLGSNLIVVVLQLTIK